MRSSNLQYVSVSMQSYFRQMIFLIKTYKKIKSVRIHWNIAYTNDLIAKPLILNLPPTDKYTLISNVGFLYHYRFESQFGLWETLRADWEFWNPSHTLLIIDVVP